MENAPLFFHPDLEGAAELLRLEEETARHGALVLRMGVGQHLRLTDGQGKEILARIQEVKKHQVNVQIEGRKDHPRPQPGLRLGLAFTRHASRNEWLLEKAAEMGVHAILPLTTARSTPWKTRPARWNHILRAAMLQSQQFYLPQLESPLPFSALGQYKQGRETLYIAHCAQGERVPLIHALEPGRSALILIGPEGDFTSQEIQAALEEGFQPVSLGEQRLRTETAALAAAMTFHMINLPKP